MKYLIILCVLFLVTKECVSWCSQFPQRGYGIGCFFDGKFIPHSKSRTYEYPDCIKCSCLPDKISRRHGIKYLLSCCSVGMEIRSHAPECEVIQNGCYQRAVLKTNHAEDCPSFGGVGR